MSNHRLLGIFTDFPQSLFDTLLQGRKTLPPDKPLICVDFTAYRRTTLLPFSLFFRQDMSWQPEGPKFGHKLIANRWNRKSKPRPTEPEAHKLSGSPAGRIKFIISLEEDSAVYQTCNKLCALSSRINFPQRTRTSTIGKTTHKNQ